MASLSSLFILAVFAFTSSSAKVIRVGQASAVIDGCVINCNLGAYLPHTSDCSKFIQCAPYGPAVMNCPRGLIWDQHILTCTYTYLVPCETGKYLTPDGKPCNGLPTEVPPTQAPTTKAPTQPPTEEPKPDPTTKAPTHPPTEEPKPDPTTKAPTQPPTEEPKPDPTTKAPTQPPTEEPKPDPTTKAPTQPPTEEPKPDPTTKAPTQPPTEAHPTRLPTVAPTEDPSSGEGTSGESSSSEEESSAEECDFECPRRNGVFAHPRDCRRYFRCIFREAEEHKCPAGLHFSSKVNTCTLPALAKCKANPDAKC